MVWKINLQKPPQPQTIGAHSQKMIDDDGDVKKKWQNRLWTHNTNDLGRMSFVPFDGLQSELDMFDYRISATTVFGYTKFYLLLLLQNATCEKAHDQIPFNVGWFGKPLVT